MRWIVRGFLLLSVAPLAGCLTTRSYVDPQFHHANYSDLKRVEPPYALSIKTLFQVNGVDRPRSDRAIEDHLERSLRASGVVIPYDGTGHADGALVVVVNDTGNMAAAKTKGVATGLTWGLVGSRIADNFEITIRFTQAGSTTEQLYHHALFSTIGNASGPDGMQAVPAGTAVNQITDDVVLNFLKDMQDAGRLLPK